MAVEEQPEYAAAAREARAHLTLLLLALPAYAVHFKSSSYLQPHTLDLLDKKACKQILKETAGNVALSAALREAIGGDGRYWSEMVEVVRAGVRGLEKRSFSGMLGEQGGVDYESTSGALIAGNYPGLWRDLERLNDLISIARNVLTIGAVAQDLAASYTLEAQIFRLINCCVRVTARGYDGDAGTGEEEKWQWIVNAYKKLLITCLQWLNNLVAGNEVRKLGLWGALFDSPTDSLGLDGDIDSEAEREKQQLSETPPLPTKPQKPSPPITSHDILLAYGTNGSSRISPLEMEGAVALHSPDPTNQAINATGFRPLPPQIAALAKKNHYDANGYVFFTASMKSEAVEIFQRDHGRSPTLAEIHRAIPVLWEDMRRAAANPMGEKKMWETWQGAYDRAVRNYHEDLDRWEKGLPLKAVEDQQQQGKHDGKLKLEGKDVEKVKEDGSVDVEERVRLLEERLRAEFEASGWMEAAVAPVASAGASFTEREGANPAPSTSTLEPRTAVSIDGKERDDTRMLFTADAGAKILESGKAELMKRLEGYAAEDELAKTETVDSKASDIVAVRGRGRGRRKSRQSLSSAFAPPDEIASAEENEVDEDDEDESDEDDEEDEEEEDYPGSSEDGRGLLTDVPLILGPSEIEVLPMLVMSAIYPTTTSKSKQDDQNSTTLSPTQDGQNSNASLTTHLLLTRTPGRNLLRELLIFVAAWDLREEELYFKFMVKITQAILEAGLMPYAYHSFRDRSRSKDIISPAQAVILKLLTTIFRQRRVEEQERQGNAWMVGEAAKDPRLEGIPILAVLPPPTPTDLHLLNFLFTEFRQHIIPQTCALIFLQGQIHRGRASAEDFPLNLWDMERMYEGVYQVLEFFAVVGEEPRRELRESFYKEKEGLYNEVLGEGRVGKTSWKGILGRWEMSSELVTLLRELEAGIPKLSSTPQVPAQQVPKRIATQRSLSADAATMPTVAGSVERPFDMVDDSALPPNSNRIFEAETPLTYPEDPIVPPPTMHDQDEPSDFEWRNLKKLTVLVLSSLIWKNKEVQDQVRDCGGLEALVACCKPDEHNPYIREHAIMCLRFAVEDNEENAEVIKRMAAEYSSASGDAPSSSRTKVRLEDMPAAAMKADVPREVLDTHGYETFTDSRGQIGLRSKKEADAARAARAVYRDLETSIATDRAATASAPPVPLPNLPEHLSLDVTSTVGTSNKYPKLSPSAAATTKMTAEKAAELMQNALRDLPLGEKLVTDRQKAEALARLDRAFESTEKALGGGEVG